MMSLPTIDLNDVFSNYCHNGVGKYHCVLPSCIKERTGALTIVISGLILENEFNLEQTMSKALCLYR